MSQKPVERVMLEVVAYHDPIDYHRLKRLVGERLREYDTDRHQVALDNLLELGMVEKPGMAHEYVHITQDGWEHLGGVKSRYGRDIDPGTVTVCPICAADEIANESWSSALY